MSLYITSLNSGSNGNCYYIGNSEEAVLIDAGLSCRETEKRMRHLGLSMQLVKAIFISHEHGDHISGLRSISHKYKLPVYITDETLRHSRLLLEEYITQSFLPHQPVHIGGLSITAFPKHHDAVDPHSFIVSGNGINIGVITDIGIACDNVIHHFRQCHAAFLEANYDEVMLEKGRYPYSLKNRIRSGKGHLSNRQALELFKEHRPAFMSHLLLSHLSRDNNDPEMALELFNDYRGETNVIVASRYHATDVYHISSDKQVHANAGKTYLKPIQATLF